MAGLLTFPFTIAFPFTKLNSGMKWIVNLRNYYARNYSCGDSSGFTPDSLSIFCYKRTITISKEYKKVEKVFGESKHNVFIFFADT
jgi:hypothetical protein